MNESKLMLGSHRCEVVSVDDPQKLMLVQVRVIGLWDGVQDKDLPWAEYVLPVGARANDGDFKPCQVGDLVWCVFDQGDSRYPLITGACFHAPNRVPNMPAEAFAGDDSYQHKRTDIQPVPDASEYHKDRVSTQFNFMIERTQTGALRATHKATGTAIEITKDGELVLHSEQDSFESTEMNKTLEAKLAIKVIGKKEISIESVDSTIDVKASKQISITSNNANVKVSASSSCTVDAPSIALNGGSPIVTTAHICHWTGTPHGDGSSTCTAGR